MMNKLHILLLGIILISCTENKRPQLEYEKEYVIVKIWRVPSVYTLDDLSPRYKGVLSNGDTIRVISNTMVGDTITYKYVHYDYEK